MKKTIELIISPTGEIRLETKGFSGAECVTASEFLEKALGRRLSEQKTSAYLQTNSSQQNSIHQES